MSLVKKGLSSSIPIIIGYLPVAFTFGVTSVSLGFTKFETVLMSILVFAGASQFVLISLLPLSAINAIFVPVFLNLRHIVYAFVLSKRFKIKKPMITAWGLTDEVFATSLTFSKHIDRKEGEKFIWGLELGAYLSWVVGTAFGVLGGSFFVSNDLFYPSLVFSLVLLFWILLVANLEDLYHVYAAIVGGLIALFFHYLGYTSLGIILAGIITPVLILKVKDKNA